MAVKELTYREAIREALREEMRRDKRVFLIGIDMHDSIINHVTKGLLKEFGPERLVQTPIVESGFTGAALGAALTGMRPVVEIGNGCFIMRAYDQIFNETAKYRYICGGGNFKLPMVIRCAGHGGLEAGGGPQHAQATESRFIGSPGVQVVAPSTPADAKGLLKTAIRVDHPVLFFEHKMLYDLKGPVPAGEEGTLPIGKAAVLREGRDVTLVAYALMAHRALDAAKLLAGQGLEADVVDLRTLVPYDKETLLASVRRTGRAVLIEEGVRTGGVGAELGAFLCEEGFSLLKSPVTRVCAPDTVLPGSRYGAKLMIPQVADIVSAAKKVCGR